MEINDYLKVYQIPIGTKVVIKESHKLPELIGKTGTVVGWMDAESFGYPLMVTLDEPIYIPLPGMPLAMPFQGPHPCRPEELTVSGGEVHEFKGEIPQAFKDSLDDNKGDKPAV
jgi:hypothetical protein